MICKSNVNYSLESEIYDICFGHTQFVNSSHSQSSLINVQSIIITCVKYYFLFMLNNRREHWEYIEFIKTHFPIEQNN